MRSWILRGGDLLRREWKHLIWMLATPLVGGFYEIMDNANHGAAILATGADRAIPFIPLFIVPYILWYPFMDIGFVYLCLTDRRRYYHALFANVLGLLACYTIYHFFQTTVPRPIVTGADPFSQLVRWIYANDRPYNCFPSIHVLSSYLMLRAVLSGRSLHRKGAFAAMSLLPILIIASTLFVKQHVLLDVVGGIAVGESMLQLVRTIGSAVVPPKMPVRLPNPRGFGKSA